MDLHRLHAAYQILAREHTLPPLEIANLSIDVHHHLPPDAAMQQLQALQPVQGWLQFQSHVCGFIKGEIPTPDPAWGYLLNAEAVTALQCSVQIRASSQGVCMVLANAAHSEQPKAQLLMDHVHHLATGKAHTFNYLRYKRYWRPDAHAGLLPAFAAFDGFVHKERQ